MGKCHLAVVIATINIERIPERRIGSVYIICKVLSNVLQRDLTKVIHCTRT